MGSGFKERTIMAAVYFDRHGNIRFSWFCNDPKTPRHSRGICGAKTRKGTPCQAPPVWDRVRDKARNGRCKLHGSLSTGPKTLEGRSAIGASNQKRAKLLCDKV